MAQSQPFKRTVVLVVEDESLLRMMAVDLVEDAGCEAVEAEDADDAVLILEARTDIRIVFTDIDMPGSMDGMQLAAAIRDRWPPIKLIITSGHLRAAEVALPPGSIFFPKPYDHLKVTAKIQEFARD